jgi:hypothetical protein
MEPTKSQIPIVQTPNNFKIPISKIQNSLFWSFEFGILELIWDLEF